MVWDRSAPHKERRCFVYCLTFPNGKKYIGISTNPDIRWKGHCYNSTTEKSTPLLNAIRKYGHKQVERKILLVGSLSYAKEMEVKTISQFNTRVPCGYNLTPGGDYSPCVIPEIANKVREKLRGRKHAEETKKKMSLASLGIKKSDSHKRNISIGTKGHTNFTGRHHSEETKQKMSCIRKKHHEEFGTKGHSCSEENKQAISMRQKGTPKTKEHRMKLVAAWVIRRNRHVEA